jgi:hypothetical protein
MLKPKLKSWTISQFILKLSWTRKRGAEAVLNGLAGEYGRVTAAAHPLVRRG